MIRSMTLLVLASTCIYAAETPSDFKDISANAKKSVVFIVNIVVDDNAEDGFRVRGLGTGFMLEGSSSVVTNYHVIEDAHAIGVRTIDDALYVASGIRAFSKVKDLAIVEIDFGDTEPGGLTLSDSPVEDLDPVIVIGFPKPSAIGLDQAATVTIGNVSAQREGWTGGGSLGPVDVIQIQAPISSGSSGSPVISADGSVLGVAT